MRTEANDPEFFEQLHREFTLSSTAESDLKKRMLADYKFLEDEHGHWDADIRRQRELIGQISPQIDRMAGPIRQVINQLAQGLPSIKINPVDNGADRKQAEVRQGIIRQIEQESDADMVKLQAIDHQVKLGRGWIRLVPEWDEDGRYQTPRFRVVDDPFSIYCDPRFADYGQTEFAFIIQHLSPHDYRKRFKEDPPGNFQAFRDVYNMAPDWFPDGKIQIAEYYKVSTRWNLHEGRRIPHRTVTWHLVNATVELETTEIPGPSIPVIPFIGERINLSGEIDYKGMVRRGKHPQRMIDFQRATMQEVAALGPKAPFVAAFGQTENYKALWENINTQPYGVAVYDPVAVGGQLVPPPQRAWSEPPIQAYLQMGREFENDLRAALSMPDVQGQELRREQSGEAIRARQQQLETGASHFGLGVNRGLKLAAKILLSWLPVYYDTPRVVRMLGTDGKETSVIVHAGQAEAAQQLCAECGEDPKNIYDLSEGRYDVVISTGPSYQTQRQESRETMQEVFRVAPEMMLPLAGDLYFDTLDDPVGKKIADRMRKDNPALADEEGQPQSVPPHVKQQMEQLLEQHRMLTQIVEKQKEMLDTNQQKIQADRQRQAETIQQQRDQAVADAQLELEKARIQAETKLEIARMELEVKRQIAELEAETTRQAQAAELQHRTEVAHTEQEQATR